MRLGNVVTRATMRFDAPSAIANAVVKLPVRPALPLAQVPSRIEYVLLRSRSRQSIGSGACVAAGFVATARGVFFGVREAFSDAIVRSAACGAAVFGTAGRDATFDDTTGDTPEVLTPVDCPLGRRAIVVLVTAAHISASKQSPIHKACSCTSQWIYCGKD
jgi:hypothetical protein